MAGNPQIIELRRAHAIVTRVRIFAGLFAVLTGAWIALDALFIEAPALLHIALARIAAGGLLALVALSCRVASPTLAQARVRLVALVAVPVAFYLASQRILPEDVPGAFHGLAETYAFFPFVLAAGIGAFPLTAVEIVAVAAALFAAEIVGLAMGGLAATFGGVEMLWLLLLIEAAAGFAAASQMRLLTALIEQAMRDPLTSCLRRESGAQMLELQFGLAQRHGTAISVLFADIDHFKRVNDAFGHEAGDRVLAATAEAFRDMARETDTLIRWGGEEFVLVLPHTTAHDAVILIERLGRRGLGGLPDALPVTVSIGVAHLPGDGVRDAYELVALADKRMYRAKQAGRNRFAVDENGEPRVIVTPAGEPRGAEARPWTVPAA